MLPKLNRTSSVLQNHATKCLQENMWRRKSVKRKLMHTNFKSDNNSFLPKHHCNNFSEARPTFGNQSLNLHDFF